MMTIQWIPQMGYLFPWRAVLGIKGQRPKPMTWICVIAESQKNESSTAEHPAKRWVEEKTIV
jgi:hypothetical protein